MAAKRKVPPEIAGEPQGMYTIRVARPLLTEFGRIAREKKDLSAAQEFRRFIRVYVERDGDWEREAA